MHKYWTRFIGAVVLMNFAGGCAGVASDYAPSAVILENVNIVDAELGAIQTNQSILIIDDTIEEISSSVQPDWPIFAIRPSVSGLYVSPALIDSHIHIFDERDLQMYSTFGVMLVRNMDGWDWHLRLRDRMDGVKNRADLVTVGAQFQDANFGSLDDLKGQLQHEQTRSFDWAKLYDDVDMSALQVVRGLKSHSGLKVTGHLPDDIEVTQLIASGAYDDVAHAEELLAAMRAGSGDWRSSLDQVAKAMLRTGTALITTIINNKMIDEQRADFKTNLMRAEVQYAPPLLQVFWASEYNPYRELEQPSHDHPAGKDNTMTTLLLELVSELNQRGVVMLAGTDAPNPTTIPGFALHEELALLIQTGMSSAAALQTATTKTSAHLFSDRRVGSIVVGAMANIIISDENPLSDITVLEHFSALVRKGSYQPREAVLVERSVLSESYAHDRLALNGFSPDSADVVINYINSTGGPDAISREGLTSLIWAYMKFGNLPEARRLASFQVGLFPSDQDAEWIADYLALLSLN